MMNSTNSSKRGNFRHKRLVQTMVIIVLIFCTVYFGFQYIFSKNSISGPSMQPNFQTGNRVITVRHSGLQRGDIVILRAPDKKNTLYIKRIVGMPGDNIVSQDNRMYINGERYIESYLKQGSKMMESKDSIYSDMSYSYTYDFSVRKLAESQEWINIYNKPYLAMLKKTDRVPKGSYFVMGDHRTVSRDSRLIGFIDRDAIVGRVSLRYWPLSRFTVY
ncbi:signal peptidase I [Companilactobacillus mishanensis]|uniref:signal peptidase I n=1 Tax=Companilactobacillus mishanensis TaxID=2486008 RepID=UPI001EE965C8|nr:signal peptidase I [Companilactobacillus mishanensis]